MTTATVHKDVKKWADELTTAENREKDFRKAARNALSIYEGPKLKETPFNILYSNTETLLPALYSSTPRPVVRQRFKNQNPSHVLAAKFAQRLLEYYVDPGVPEGISFDSMVEQAVLEALVPGRGASRPYYDAEVLRDEKGEPASIEKEEICFEQVPWDNLLFGWAKKWGELPWLAIKLPPMYRKEVEKTFGKDIAEQCKFAPPSNKGMTGETSGRDSDTSDSDSDSDVPDDLRVIDVYEIWDKQEGTQLFFSPQCPTKLLKEPEAPKSKFRGFFPIPTPLILFRKVGNLIPIPLYEFYRSQAEELNICTQRIKAIVKALKVRGFYDSTVEGIEKVISADDNVLTPVGGVDQLRASGWKLDDAIWLMPIDKLIGVLQQLYTQREAAKRTLYEINGIADIMRGASSASETLGAQELKNQWGTLRLKRMQRLVQSYVREILRMVFDLAIEHFSPEELRRRSGMEIPTAAEKQQAQQAAEMMKQQAAMQPQQPGQPPAQSPQIPPELEKLMASPTIEDLVAMLKDDKERGFLIDIETNSTVASEATEDKEMVAEAMNAISQFFLGIGPLVEKGIIDFGLAQQMLLAIVKRFRFGPELEEYVLGMKSSPPAPEAGKEVGPTGPSPEQMQAEAAAAQAKGETAMMLEQQKQATIKMDMEATQAEHQLKMARIAAELQLVGIKTQAAQQQVETAREQKQLDLDFNNAAHERQEEAETTAHERKLEELNTPARITGE